MKVFLPIKKHVNTGKGFFINRLAEALQKLDIKIVTNPIHKHDISLHLTKIRTKTNSIKVVRFNGVYHNVKQKYKSMNKSIVKATKNADAVIYQSKFSKKMCNKYLRKFDLPNAIIWNGADTNYFDTIVPAKSDYNFNFFAFSRWRPHKRLNDIIQSFMLADIPNSCLFIAGDISESGLSKKRRKKVFSHKNIIYLGKLSQEEIASYLKLCNAIVHICWFDCCPNSVIESICAKKTVICNNVGGTREIVEPSGGIVCPIDKKYNYKPVDLYNPPKINRNIIVDALYNVIENERIIVNKHVCIENIALKYKEFFMSL